MTGIGAGTGWRLPAAAIVCIAAHLAVAGTPAQAQPARAAQPDTTGKRQTLPPLALPDIVVFGRSSATMREGSKLFTADKRTALDREVGAPVGGKIESRTGWGGGRALAAQPRAQAGRQGRAWMRGATYSELIGGVDYWRDVGPWRLITRMGGDGTAGHVDNSAAWDGFGEVTVEREFSPATRLRLNGGITGGRQEEWGAGVPAQGIPGVPAEAARTFADGRYEVSGEARIGRGVTMQAGAGGRHAGLRDQVRGTDMRPQSDGGWVDFALDWVTSRTVLHARGRLEGDRTRGVNPPETARLTSTELTVRALIGEASSGMLGAIVYRMNSGLGTITRVWPQAEFTSHYSERFSMYMRFRPRLDYLSLGAAREQNPFIANTFAVTPREERFNLAVGLTYILAPQMTLQFEVARRQFDRLPLWRLAPASDPWSSGLFVLDGVVNVAVNETRLDLSGSPWPGVNVHTEVTLRQPSGGGIEELSHVPRIDMSAGVNGEGPWGLDLGVRLNWLGERFGDTAGSAERRLAPATDLGFRVARTFARSLTVWLELRNVLDSDVMLWESYLQPGRTTALGLSFAF